MRKEEGRRRRDDAECVRKENARNASFADRGMVSAEGKLE